MSPRATAVMAIFFGPAAAAGDQFFSYMLVYPAAASGTNVWLHVVTVVASVVACVGLLLSYGILRRRTEVFEVDRFLAVVGLAMNAFFLLVVVVGFGLPKVMLHPTD
jgi:hypothetical protein